MTISPRDDIEGWFDWPLLYEEILATVPDNGTVVEIGSWMGKSACYLSELIKQSNKNIDFYCVDLWDDDSVDPAFQTMMVICKKDKISLKNAFLKNLDRYGVKDYVTPIKGDSAESAKLFSDEIVDMAFIDASHDYYQVVKDLNAWWPKVKMNGVFAGHDYFYAPDVRKAVDEFFKSIDRSFITIGQCWYIRK